MQWFLEFTRWFLDWLRENAASFESLRNLVWAVSILVAVTVGTILAYIRTTAANRSSQAALRQAKTGEEGHITDRFIKAIELLGHENIGVRIGAIYSLERIAQDSSRDYWPIMEALTGYLRSRKPQTTDNGEFKKTEWPKDDVLAILTVFSRRRKEFEKDNEKLNLSGAYFADLNLTKIGKNIGLEKAILSEANFSGTILTGINLSGADLSRARMVGAKLQKADLSGTILEGTDFSGADLTGAVFSKAVLRNANVSKADFSDTDLSEASISGLYFFSSNKAQSIGEKNHLDKEKLIGLIGPYCNE